MLAGGLEIQMSAGIAQLQSDMRAAKALVTEAHDSMLGAVSSLKSAFASLGIGMSMAGFVSLVKNAADAADAAAKLGDRFGIATENIVAMQHAADLAGVSSDGLTTALRGMAKSSVDAATTGGKAADAYRRLQIDLGSFLKLPMDQQFSILIERLGTMENATNRNATAATIFSRNAGQMLQMVASGAEGFRMAKEDVVAWGLALDRVDSAKIELANDAIKRAEAATKGFFTQVALAFSAGVATLANYFADSAKEAKGYREEVVSGSEWVLQAIANMADVLYGLRIAWAFVKLGIVEVFDALAQGLAKTSVLQGIADAITPLGGAFTLAGRMISLFARTGKESLENFATSTRDSLISIKNEIDALANQGAPGDKMLENMRRAFAAFQREAEKFAAARKGGGGGEDIFGIPTPDVMREQMLKVAGIAIEANKSSMELLDERYAKEQEAFNYLRENEYISDDYWQGQSMLLYASYENQKSEILLQEWMKRRQYEQLGVQAQMRAWAAAGDFLQVFAGRSKAAAFAVLAIQKGLAIAQAIQLTAVAHMQALADPFTWPYEKRVANAMFIDNMGAIEVGLIAATGIAQAATMGSSGGGGASSGSVANPIYTAPGAGSNPFASREPMPSQVEITINLVNNAPIVGPDGAQQFVEDYVIPGLADAINSDNVRVIGPNSRLAMDLKAGGG